MVRSTPARSSSPSGCWTSSASRSSSRAANASALSITASVGIALGDRISPSELLRDADIALYRAKAAGKNCCVIFEPEMHTAVQDRLSLEIDLHDALARDEFFLVYQPIFELREKRIVGAEALIRWRHADRGLLQPDEFVPVLEESGLIVDVGRWVLDQACRQTALWHAHGHRLDISVNVSVRQLESDAFLRHVRQALDDTGLDPGVAHPRDHRDRDHARRGSDLTAARAPPRRWVSGSRSTTSEPATRRSPTCGSSRSTR